MSFSVIGATAVIERRDTSREPADNKRRQCRQTETNKAKCTDEVNEVISRIEKLNHHMKGCVWRSAPPL